MSLVIDYKCSENTSLSGYESKLLALLALAEGLRILRLLWLVLTPVPSFPGVTLHSCQLSTISLAPPALPTLVTEAVLPPSRGSLRNLIFLILIFYSLLLFPRSSFFAVGVCKNALGKTKEKDLKWKQINMQLPEP